MRHLLKHVGAEDIPKEGLLIEGEYINPSQRAKLKKNSPIVLRIHPTHVKERLPLMKDYTVQVIKAERLGKGFISRLEDFDPELGILHVGQTRDNQFLIKVPK